MHQPRLNGRFAHQVELTQDDAAAVEKLVRSSGNYKDVAGIEAYQRTAILPSGRTAVTINAGGVLRTVIYEAPSDEQRYAHDGRALVQVPMLYSGCITEAKVKYGQGVGLLVSEQTRLRLAGYKTKDLPAKNLKLQRFVVEYAPDFAYFLPNSPGEWTHTQYALQRPTWYSGALAEVMQVVGGYGRQDREALPQEPLELAVMQIPEPFLGGIHQELSARVLPGYSGLPHKEGQFQCDYRWSRSNAVSFDSAGAPWLVQIDERGVFAMPLPMVPATSTRAFREYVTEKGDEELLALIDRFGGMPSGECFPPAGQDFEAWRRAGVIVKVCDSADFYLHQAYFEACGWSMNSSGTEGVNTCYNFDGNDLMQGYTYGLHISLGAAPERGLLRLQWDMDAVVDRAALDAYLQSLYKALTGKTAREGAIKYKVRRSSISDIESRARSWRSAAPDIDYWENLEMKPIAVHGGRMARTGSGSIYWPFKTLESVGRLKFPDLRAKGCVSFDMRSPDYKGKSVVCDTVVFACYVNDELQVVKYFYDDRKFYQDKDSTFEEMMVVGQWEETTTNGESGLLGNFYTSSFDERQQAAPTTIYTHIVGTDMGYGQPRFKTPGLFESVGSLSRERYYMHRTKTRVVSGLALDVAVCVPVFARDCIVHAYQERAEETISTESTAQHGMPDPNSYQLWCYDNIFHFNGVTTSGNLGVPTSVNGTPVYVDTHTYLPTEWSDFADSGNWYQLPPGGFLDVTAICGPYTSRFSSAFNAGGVQIGGEAPGFSPMASRVVEPGVVSGRLHISIRVGRNVLVHKDVPHGWYWSYSPSNQDYFYRDAAWVCFGNREYASFSELDGNKLRRRWGGTQLADHLSAHHFIGVIHE